MTVPPAEPPPNGEHPAHRSPEPTDHEVDASFAALVAGWDNASTTWPEPSSPDVEPAPTPAATPTAKPEPARDLSDHAEDDEDDEDEGHYEPPESPPLPTLHRATVGALALIALGMFLLFVPGVIGMSATTGFALGLLSITGGLAWLLSRLRPGPPTDSGWDDGAQI